MRLKILYILFTASILTACIEDFDIVLDNNNDYVCIDAIITTADTIQGAYIRKTAKVDNETHETTHEFILDAKISLTDNTTGQEYQYNSPGNNYDRVITYEYSNGYTDYYTECVFGANAYVLPGFRPTAGRSYTINIEVNGRVYSSTQFLHADPLVEGITFRPYKASDSGIVEDGYDAYNPVLNIGDSEPDKDNYYIFIGNVYAWSTRLRRTGYSSYVLPITPISEKDFRPGFNAIDVNEAMGLTSHGKGSGICYGEKYNYSLWSVSEENYKYLCTIKDHMTTDGGVYTPYLSTPPTNFSGTHVMGQFMAINEKYYEGYVTYRNIE